MSLAFLIKRLKLASKKYNYKILIFSHTESRQKQYNPKIEHVAETKTGLGYDVLRLHCYRNRIKILLTIYVKKWGLTPDFFNLCFALLV
jgi:hypothetical protein